MQASKSTTYNNTRVDRKLDKEIDDLVGKRFGLLHKIKNGLVGSEPFVIHQWQGDFDFDVDSKDYDRKCNIELRPNGIIVHYRKKLSTFIWPIPFHQLTIYKSGEVISIYQNTNFVKMKPMLRRKKLSPFIQKVITAKTEYMSSHHLL